MENTATESPFNVYRTRVRSHHTDLNGGMYHGTFFDVFDDARIETFRLIGYDYSHVVAGGWTLVIRRVECEYFAPARLDDQLDITVLVERMTVATLVIQYHCALADTRVAAARATFAFLDGRAKPIRFPADLRQVIQDHPQLIATSSELPGSNRRSRA